MTHQPPPWVTQPYGAVVLEHAVTVEMIDEVDEEEDLHVNPVPVPLRVSYLTSQYITSPPGQVGLLYVHLPGHADDDEVYVAFEHYNGALCMYYITDQMRDTEKIVLISDTTKLKEASDAPLSD